MNPGGMPRGHSGHRQGRALLAAALLPLLAVTACSTTHYPVNAAFVGEAPELRYARRPMLAGDAPGGVFIHAAFSGGGTRAAALAYGVLEVLHEARFFRDGKQRRLSEDLTILAGVSGGAVAAAAYVTFGPAFFERFACGFLRGDLQEALVSRFLAPSTLHRLTSTRFGRSDVLAELLDERLFAGATFGDLARRKSRPMAIVSATSLHDGERFEFTQESFDGLCSDLSAFPVSRAVAASLAVPGVLSPVTVWNHGPGCLRGSPIVRSPLYKPYELPYLHLVDGGLSDNLGVRNTIETVERLGGFTGTMRALDLRGVRRIVYLIVNARSDPGFEESGSPDVPGIVRTLRSVADIPIDRYSALSLDQLRARFARWLAEVRAGRDAENDGGVARDVEMYVIEVSLPLLEDADERRYLQRLPTSLSLPKEDIDRVRRAARRLLEQSPDFRRLLVDLGASVARDPASDTARRLACAPPR